MVGILSRSLMGQVQKSYEEMMQVQKQPLKSKPESNFRTSSRLQIIKKRAELARNRQRSMLLLQQKQQQEAEEKQIKRHEVIELSQFPIEHGNPSHKLLFLTRLGLIPSANPNTRSPPYVSLHRLSQAEIDDWTEKKPPEKPAPEWTALTPEKDTAFGDVVTLSDSDEDDLDLELVVSPVDIPEIFEELIRKKPKRSASKVDINNIPLKSQETPSRAAPERGFSALRKTIIKRNHDTYQNGNNGVLKRKKKKVTWADSLVSFSPAPICFSPVTISVSAAPVKPTTKHNVLHTNNNHFDKWLDSANSNPFRPLFKAPINFINQNNSELASRMTRSHSARNNIPCVDLTFEEEGHVKDIDQLRERLLGFNTVLEYAEPHGR